MSAEVFVGRIFLFLLFALLLFARFVGIEGGGGICQWPLRQTIANSGVYFFFFLSFGEKNIEVRGGLDSREALHT